jgi:hypothetical protein
LEQWEGNFFVAGAGNNFQSIEMRYEDENIWFMQNMMQYFRMLK